MGIERDRWRQTFEAEQQRMWQTLLAHTRNPDIAADAVAEAFAQGLRRGVAVRDPAAWAWRSASASPMACWPTNAGRARAEVMVRLCARWSTLERCPTTRWRCLTRSTAFLSATAN